MQDADNNVCRTRREPDIANWAQCWALVSITRLCQDHPRWTYIRGRPPEIISRVAITGWHNSPQRRIQHSHQQHDNAPASPTLGRCLIYFLTEWQDYFDNNSHVSNSRPNIAYNESRTPIQSPSEITHSRFRYLQSNLGTEAASKQNIDIKTHTLYWVKRKWDQSIYSGVSNPKVNSYGQICICIYF